MDIIDSFASIALRKMVLSERLCPSNAPVLCKMPALSKLFEELNTSKKVDVEFFKTKTVDRKWYEGKELVRLAARVASIFAIGAFIAPIGCIYHGSQILRYSFTYLRNPNSQTSDKIVQHAKCFFSDLTRFILFAVMPSICLSHTFNIISIAKMSKIIVPSYMGSLSVIFAALFPAFFLDEPAATSPWFSLGITHSETTKKDAFFLKRDLGIVSENNDLYEFKFELDGKNLYYKDYFQALRFFKGLEIIQLMNAHGIHIACYPPSNEYLTEQIDRRNLDPHLKAQFTQLFQDLDVLDQFALKGKAAGMGTFAFFKKEFPIDPDQFREFNKERSHSHEKPEDKMETVKKEINALNINEADLDNEYKEFRHRILNTPHISPFQILGIDDPSQAKKAYLKWVLRIHPDKVKDDVAVKKEAAILFRILQDAYAVIK